MSEFTYCLNASTIRPTPLLEKVRIAGEAGYQAVELWDDEIQAFYQAGGSRADLSRALANSGLAVASVIALHGWATAQGDAYAKSLDEARRKLDRAAALGSLCMVCSPPQEPVDLGQTTERFGRLVRLGREAGVEPSMEFLGFVDGVNTLASAWAIASGCGEPGATVIADVFHMVRGGGSIDDLLTVPGDRLACFHINDLPASPTPTTQTDADRVMVGEGIADLPRVIANLRAIGYRGPLSLELFNRKLWQNDPAEVVRLGLERIKALVETR